MTKEQFDKEQEIARREVMATLLRLEKKRPVFLAFVAIYDWDIEAEGGGNGKGEGSIAGMHPAPTTPHLVMSLTKLIQNLLEKKIGLSGGLTLIEKEE